MLHNSVQSYPCNQFILQMLSHRSKIYELRNISSEKKNIKELKNLKNINKINNLINVFHLFHRLRSRNLHLIAKSITDLTQDSKKV